MDDTSDLIKKFEELCEKTAQKTKLPIYTSENKNREHFQGLYSPQAIVSNITLQIKAIQKADTVTNKKNARKCLDKYKKSSFLPVNMIPKDVTGAQTSHANKFETQFELDTQLMDIIDNAEELIDQKNGMTQEFESTFHEADIETICKVVYNENDSLKSNRDKENGTVYKETALLKDNNLHENKKVEISEVINDFHDQTQFNENFMDKPNSHFDEAKSCPDNAVDDDDLPCSYVFQPIKKSNTPSPLVFDLNTFEDFEKIALPIIEEHTDVKSAKQLINSQIVGRELHFEINDKPLLCPDNVQLSPVLKKSSDKLKATKNVDFNDNSDANSNKDNISLTEFMKDSVFLKDEIIFSSDEESEYIRKQSQDLPLTCALETSFYNQSDVLDKTMYVGFQTASNRSIQVCTESYTKAKSFLDNLNEDDHNKLTLTELVELCDDIKKKSEVPVINENVVTPGIQSNINLTNATTTTNLIENNISSNLENPKPDSLTACFESDFMQNIDIATEITESIEIDDKEKTEDSKFSECNISPLKRKCERLMAASNKRIKLSQDALAKRKEEFQDLEDHIESENMLKKEHEELVNNKISIAIDTQDIDEDIINEFANDMPLISNKKDEVTEFVGFRTASKKNIHISASALAKTKKIFDDINTSEKRNNEAEDFELHDIGIGFKTASNKNIKITTEALTKAKSFLDDSQDRCLNWDQPSTSKQHVCGFKTASNKKILVSAEALSKSQPLFQDIIDNNLDYDLESDIDRNTDGNHLSSDNNVGFRTANNKKIEISEAAYIKTKNMFKNIVMCEDELAKHDEEEVLKDAQLELELQEVNKLQHEICDDFSRAFESAPFPSKESAESKFCGFKTASNRAVNISEKAMIESKKLFADLDLDKDCDCGSKTKIANLTTKSKSENYKNCIQISNITKIETCSNDDKINQFLSGSNTSTFPGFKTASNKEVKISEKALAQSKKLFDDLEIDNFNISKEKEDNSKTCVQSVDKEITQESEKEKGSKIDVNKKENSISKFQLFHSASKKPIQVSNKALEKSREIFKDIVNDEHVAINIEPQYNTSQSGIFRGFETANKKPIKISAQALAKSMALFRDIDSENICNEHVNNVENNKKNDELPKNNEKEFKGFQTASKKPVLISEEALAKSKKLLNEIVSDGSETQNESKIQKGQSTFTRLDANKPPNFQGFETASRKPVQISAKALAKGLALFKDTDNSKISELNNVQKLTYPVPDSPAIKETVFRGFETASRKPVKVSAEALAKSMALFKEIDSNNGETYELSNIQKPSYPVPDLPAIKEPTFGGFKTASKKPVQVSAEALAKSLSLFRDIDNDNTNIPNLSSDQKHKHQVKDSPIKEPIFRGFETASRKSVHISADALAKSKLLFKDIDAEVVETPFKFAGFQTGNNKTVAVSDEALIASQKILKDVAKNDTKSVAVKDTGFRGFETASKKKVLISEDALKRSRLLFQDINDVSSKSIEKFEANNVENRNKENSNSNIQKTPFSFTSANNNRVEISQDALIKSRRVLTETEDHKTIANKKPEHSLERLIDTQVINNFEETLCTEDFCKDTTPRQCKRSGSPILSCPKPKRRKKFETPYSQTVPKRKIVPNIETEINPVFESEMVFNKDYKKSKRYTLKDLADAEKSSEKNIDYEVPKLNFDALLNMQFKGKRNDVTDVDMSVEGLKDLFQSAVNKKLIPEGWLDNHIRLIIWKLLSYEVRFPFTLSGVCTVRNVLEQLKHRYDRELYNAERPALRKILEKDDVASKSLVLCVAAVYVDGVSVSSVPSVTCNVELLLTDGWYCVKATIDRMLTKLVYDEKITVGCKIMTNGAELVNCEQGVAPWEDTSAIRLKIFGNSTRRARWDARLGYHGNAAILAPLSSVKVEGGKVSKLRLYVTRVYPALFVEKFEDGSTVTRSERLETIHQLKYESERQAVMEKLYEEVEKELSDQESQDSENSYNKKRRTCDGSQLISSSQTRSLEERCNRRREKIIQNIQTKLQDKMEKHGLNTNRNVIPLLKVRVAGIENNNKVTKGLMSIWKPNDAITEIIREGIWIEVLNVVPTGIRYSEIQISAGRNSVFRESKFKGNDKMLPHTKILKRKCYHIKELAKNSTMTTDYNEIDTVGFVFQIDPPTDNFESSKQPFQNLYLTDTERNIICVNFWGGLKKFGFHNVLDTGQVVACVNLQKRTGNTKKCIPHFRVTEFSYFTKTPKNIEARNSVEELVKKFSGLDKRKYCEECIVLKNNFNKTVNFNNENISPYRINNIHNLTRNKIFIDSPLAQKPIDENLNLTGLDFESTFKQDTQDLSPQALLRKKKVNEKISKLKMYGEPPPLSPIHIINKSKSAFKSYKSPLASNENVTSVNKVTENSRKKDTDIHSSPVLAMNRTYVRNVNPVKLNFSKVQDDEEVDHFAEEFDGSPPLSLD